MTSRLGKHGAISILLGIMLLMTGISVFIPHGVVHAASCAWVDASGHSDTKSHNYTPLPSPNGATSEIVTVHSQIQVYEVIPDPLPNGQIAYCGEMRVVTTFSSNVTYNFAPPSPGDIAISTGLLGIGDSLIWWKQSNGKYREDGSETLSGAPPPVTPGAATVLASLIAGPFNTPCAAPAGHFEPSIPFNSGPADSTPINTIGSNYCP